MKIEPVEIEYLMKDSASEGISDLGDAAASAGDQIEQTAEQIKKKIKEQKEVVKLVERDLKELEKAFKTAAPGEQWMETKAEIAACNKVLEEEKVALKHLEEQHEKVAETGKRLSMQLRELYEDMAKMRLEGKENTEQYRQLEQQAALLADTLGDVKSQTSILAHDNAGLQGVISGATGAAGAMTAATGVFALFAGQNEDLIKIQTKLQAVMAITMGLQQVMNTLNKDSAFRLVTVRKAKDLLTAATGRLSVALGISNVAAKALMATLTLGLSVAIGVVIALWDKFSSKQKKAKEEMQDFADKVAQSSASMISNFRKMVTEWEKLGDSLIDKKKYIEDNQEAFKKLGVKINDVVDAENLFVDNQGAFIQSIMLKAKAAAAMEAASDKYKEAIEKMTRAEAMEDTKKTTRYHNGTFKSYTVNNTEKTDLMGQASQLEEEAASLILKSIGFSEEELQLLADAGIKTAEEIIEGSLGELQNMIAEKRKALKDITDPKAYAEAMKGIDELEKKVRAITGEGSREKKDNRLTNNLAELELRARQKIEDQALELREAGYEKQREMARVNFEREKERINKEERERLELYRKLKEAGEDVNPEQEATIKAQAAAQRVNAGAILDQELSTIDTKQKKEQADTFARMLEPYRDFAQQRLDIEAKFNKDITTLRDSLSTNRLEEIGQQMTQQFGTGNVGLLARPMIDAAKLVEKGWEDAGEGIATVYSSQYGIEDATGKVVEILITPILPNGDVLSEEELDNYVDNVLNGAEDLLAADTLGIVISVDVDEAGEAGEKLHQLQEIYYDLKNNLEENISIDDQIGRALVVAEEEKERTLQELDLVFAQKDVAFQALASRLGNMSIRELEKALQQAEQALKAANLSGTGKADQTAVLRAKVATIQNELKLAKAEADINAPTELQKWEKTSKAVRKCKQEVDGILDSMDFLDEATQQALTACSNIAGGAIAMIDGIKLLSIGAAESISAVEKASVILAIVGAAIKIMTAIFSMASAAEQRHQQALAEIQSAKIAFQREYNLLLLEQNLLLEEASNIFGEQKILKAANAVEVYRKAIAGYKDELKGTTPTMTLFERWTNDAAGSYAKRMADYEAGIGALAQAQIVTGHKKTGLFGWGKGKDTYSGVLEVYPDLIDAEGRLDAAMAETILSTRKMDDETRNLIQSLIDLQEKADAAQEELRDYLKDTFGSLGDGIMDSITDAIINKGNDAWATFGKSGAKVLEDLGQQLAYSLFFAKQFDKLQEQLEGIYGSGKSEEQIANDAMRLVGNFYQGIGSQMDAAQDFLEDWKRKASQYGFDLWSDEEETTTQSGRTGAITSITQDQANSIDGRLAAGQMHWASIDSKLDDVGTGLNRAVGHLAEIADNTAYCGKRLEKVEEHLQYIKDHGLKMK